MNIDERHRAILEMIAGNGSVSTAEIQRRFSVSYDSAKRDLRILEEKGLLKRTHGGAISVGESLESFSKVRKETSERVEIESYGLSLISDGDCVYIPPTAEGRWMIGNLPDRGIMVVVNSPELAVLSARRQVRCVLIGGGVNGLGICEGGDAVEAVRAMRFDKSFIVTEGMSADFGASVKSTEEAAFLRCVIKASRKVVGLCRHEKLGLEAAVRVCGAEEFSCVITDEGAESQELGRLRKVVNLVVVGSGAEAIGSEQSLV